MYWQNSLDWRFKIRSIRYLVSVDMEFIELLCWNAPQMPTISLIVAGIIELIPEWIAAQWIWCQRRMGSMFNVSKSLAWSK